MSIEFSSPQLFRVELNWQGDGSSPDLFFFFSVPELFWMFPGGNVLVSESQFQWCIRSVSSGSRNNPGLRIPPELVRIGIICVQGSAGGGGGGGGNSSWHPTKLPSTNY